MWLFAKCLYITSIIFSFGFMYWGMVIDAKTKEISTSSEFKTYGFISSIGFLILSFIPAFNFIIILPTGVYCFNAIDFDLVDISIGDVLNLFKKKK